MAAARPLVIALVSGGLDSAVCLAEAVRDHEVAALHINYGQRTEARVILSKNRVSIVLVHTFA